MQLNIKLCVYKKLYRMSKLKKMFSPQTMYEYGLGMQFFFWFFYSKSIYCSVIIVSQLFKKDIKHIGMEK